MKKRIISMALALILVVSMGIPAFAAETKNVKITADYDGDGQADFSYIIPNVTKTEKYKTADKSDTSKWVAFPNGWAFAGSEVTVHTIDVGTKIDMGGMYGWGVCRLQLNNGKLEAPDDSSVNYDKIITITEKGAVTKKSVRLNGGRTFTYNDYPPESYATFNEAGYYAFILYPFYSSYSEVGSQIAGLKFEGGNGYGGNYKYGSVVLHVVKPSDNNGSAGSSKETGSNTYQFKDIPTSWIKPVEKNGTVVGYDIAVPNSKTATFKISGTQFESAKVNGTTVNLSSGKQKTFKDVKALSLTLRKPSK